MASKFHKTLSGLKNVLSGKTILDKSKLMGPNLENSWVPIHFTWLDLFNLSDVTVSASLNSNLTFSSICRMCHTISQCPDKTRNPFVIETRLSTGRTIAIAHEYRSNGIDTILTATRARYYINSNRDQYLEYHWHYHWFVNSPVVGNGQRCWYIVTRSTCQLVRLYRCGQFELGDAEQCAQSIQCHQFIFPFEHARWPMGTGQQMDVTRFTNITLYEFASGDTQTLVQIWWCGQQ